MTAPVEELARTVVDAPENLRRQRWHELIDRSRAAARDRAELARALDLNARMTTRVRELCEIRKQRTPWNIPPAEQAGRSAT